MPDERDRRRLITPPPGVRAQTASQTASESWEGHDSYTPVGDVDADGALERMGRRVKQTAQNSVTTLDRVASLEAKVESIVPMLMDALKAEREERQRYTAVSVASFQADMELDRSRAMAALEMERNAAQAGIESRKAAAEYRRQLGLKILAGVAAVWALVSTIVLARQG